MRLIGAGLPRTGTLSQKVALEMLGFGPCYHMVNVLGDLDQAALWRRALDGDAQWEEIFGGFDSTVDWPGSYFYRELIEYYPDAKVLLSTRDSDSWARSMRETIHATLYGDDLLGLLSRARCEVDPKWCGFIDLMKEMWGRSGLLDGPGTTDAWMAQGIERFQEEVKATVPADRLLVWCPADGWEPLCRFLEVPIPGMPFPHLNDAKVFVERIVDGALLAIHAWRGEPDEVSIPVS
jgi:hypothetical protein